MELTGHQRLLKEINRMAVVRHLCANPGVSRAALATSLQLTKSTVSVLVRELMEQGWIIEREIVATGDLGRRPTPLFVHPDSLVLLGADLGIENVRVVATSLTGVVLASAVIEYGADRRAPACISALARDLVEVHQKLDSRVHKVIGIGIGLPGGVDESSGILHFAPNLGWRDVNFGVQLREQLRATALEEAPIFLQNEADVAALGELEFGNAHLTDPLLYVSVSHGVGAGVIVNDRLLTGHRGFAGEVGHTILAMNGPLCSCGRQGCAEALISFKAILRQANAADGADAGESPSSSAPVLSYLGQIQRRLGAGEQRMEQAVERAGAYLGVLLQNLTAAYDPACIVLGGAAIELGERFLQPALNTLHHFAAAAGLPPPRVQVSRYGADAVALGAAALARYRLTRPLIAATFGARVED